MKRTTLIAVSLMAAGSFGLGCATSADYRRDEAVHDANARDAAANGQYGAAQSEQRKAEDSRHDANNAAINEGQPMPQSGYVAPPPAQ